MFIKQYRCCRKRWWGGSANNTCKSCGQACAPLPLAEMLGIGWFSCAACDRTFAGKARGDVTSPCNGCHRQLLPEFIVPGSDAARPDGGTSTHNCALCNGRGDCPIAGRLGGGRRRR
jgi:hypothetical protein